ncbi:MAG: hypothetical protein LAO09_13475 [Acidobacteriia bacterium]|nr:hypothetical protein [Terriglobia bacterium]
MGSRKISSAAWVLLLGTLAVIVLIVILPQVDLLDTAFHCNTSPLGIHARCTSAPAALLSASVFQSAAILRGSGTLHQHGEFAVDPTHGLVTVLDSCLRC